MDDPGFLFAQKKILKKVVQRFGCINKDTVSLHHQRNTHTNQTSTIMTHTEISSAVQHLIEVTKAKLQIVDAQILMITSAPCIESCNSICAFPTTGLTIGVDESGKPIILNATTPTQFTPETARKICENVTNGRGEHPIIVSPLNFYTAEKQRLTEILEMFNK